MLEVRYVNIENVRRPTYIDRDIENLVERLEFRSTSGLMNDISGIMLEVHSEIIED